MGYDRRKQYVEPGEANHVVADVRRDFGWFMSDAMAVGIVTYDKASITKRKSDY